MRACFETRYLSILRIQHRALQFGLGGLHGHGAPSNRKSGCWDPPLGPACHQTKTETRTHLFFLFSQSRTKVYNRTTSGSTATLPSFRPPLRTSSSIRSKPPGTDGPQRNKSVCFSLFIQLTNPPTQSLQDVVPLLHDPDPDMRHLAQEEYYQLQDTLQHYLATVFPDLLLPRPPPTAHLSALVELRTGVGGSEASLFLGDLLRMYTRLANARQRDAAGSTTPTTSMQTRLRGGPTAAWTPDVVSRQETESGGVKDAVLEIRGAGAYDVLRWESGVHRVQRVPATESSGRTHTSTVAVVVRCFPLGFFSRPHPDGRVKVSRFCR